MAKESAIVKNNKRENLAKKHAKKREEFKRISKDKNESWDVRLAYMIKLSELPRNSSKVRYKNRCKLTGRPRSYYRKFGISRVVLRELCAWGKIPGLTKSSW